MEYIFKTVDELEAKQLLAAKNALHALYQIETEAFVTEGSIIDVEQIKEILDSCGIVLHELWK